MKVTREEVWVEEGVGDEDEDVAEERAGKRIAVWSRRWEVFGDDV